MTVHQWQPIETAPKDGTRFLARGSRIERFTGILRYIKRQTWWGKTSHIPLYGWCHGRVEDTDLWEPTHWKTTSGDGESAPAKDIHDV